MIDGEDLRAGRFAQQALELYKEDDDCVGHAVATLLNAAALAYLLSRWDHETTQGAFERFARLAYDRAARAIAEAAEDEGSA